MSSMLLSLVVGGVLGALLGRFGCNSGCGPLVANWRRGAIYGMALGLMLHFAVGQRGDYQPPKNVKAITEAEFQAEVLQAGRPVVVDFFAPWCGPCKTLAPRLDKLASEFQDRIKFVAINVDEAPLLAAKLNVEGIPTLVFVGPDGKILDQTVGVPTVEALRARLQALSTVTTRATAG